jgi:hypothetical protein
MKRYIITESQLEKIVNNKVRPINENSDAEEVLKAFDTFLDEKGLCTIGEDVINEDIITDLSNTLKKGVLIASAIVALGLMTPQEAQAQTGSKAKKEFVDIFKKRQKMKCKNVGKQKIKTDKVVQPTKYFVKKLKAKFDNEGEYATFAFIYKDGVYKPINKKVFEKYNEKVNFVDMSKDHWNKAKTQLEGGGKTIKDVGFSTK